MHSFLFLVFIKLTVTGSPPPAWTGVVQIDNSINTGFKGVSDGLRIMDPNSVLRTRTGDYEADGARWGARAFQFFFVI